VIIQQIIQPFHHAVIHELGIVLVKHAFNPPQADDDSHHGQPMENRNILVE
jgi:hypothetical protein